MPLRKLSLIFSTLMLAQGAWAHSPVYRDGQLSLPFGVMVDEEGMHYFRDISFTTTPFGQLDLTDLEELPLAQVTDAALEQDAEASTFEVVVNGELPTPCHAIEEAAVVYPEGAGGEILVALAYTTTLEDGEVCAQVITPFTERVSLEPAGLASGAYQVNVNDQVELEFELSRNEGELVIDTGEAEDA